jgi:hypothetical protein
LVRIEAWFANFQLLRAAPTIESSFPPISPAIEDLLLR